MKNMNLIGLLIVLLSISSAYDTINDNNHIMAYYQEWSYMPVMHVYYNRHFSKSKQFQDFIDVVQQAEYQVQSYAKILFTDCQVQSTSDKKNQNNKKQHQIYACRQIARLNQNRMIVGYIPSSQFTNFGQKVMQSPPTNKIYDHFTDVYTVQQIVRFINQMVPNFYKQISNNEQFQQFKKPRYSPKLIYATKQGQVAQVIKQLGIQFFLKFDMAYVEDLTQTVINQLQITSFPSLCILKYNYETDKLNIFRYNSNDFSQGQYTRVRKFLQEHALKQKRNDYLFHLIQMPTSSQILTVDSDAALKQALDTIHSWIFVQQGQSFEKLIQLKDKYGQFYQYIHYLKPESPQNKILLINYKLNIQYEYDQQKILYKTLNAQEFQTNSTIWLRKDYVVVGVRQKYGHLCTVVDKALFIGHAQCFIIDQKAYQQVGQSMGMKFQYGFVISAKKQSNKVHGNQIKSIDFESVYRTIQYATKMKVKQIIDDFIQNPIKNITSTTTIQDICVEPFKKCIFYFSQKSSDNTRRQYLKLQVAHFVNEYKIYEVDLSCNKHIYEEIPQFKQTSGGLIAYHPRINKYVYLKAKMTRNIIKRFLQLNNQDKKALPFKQFLQSQVTIKSCRENTQNQQQTSQKSQFQSEL